MYTIYKIQLYQSQQLFVLEMQFLYPNQKPKPNQKKNNNFYPKWKARKTLTGKQICCCCVLQIKKNKNVVSGKFLYANTTSGYRTTQPRHSTPTVHRPHTEHLAHPFQR